MGIYFDNAATSFPKPECVYAETLRFMRECGASPGRGSYQKAMEADRLVYKTRKALCKLLGVERPGQIAFTANVTEALNLALKGYLNPGDKVLTTRYEHNAMWRPLKNLERQIGVEILQIDCSPAGELDLEDARRKLGQGVRLLAVSHGSNVIGSITPLEALIPMAHAQGAIVLTDAAQTAGAYPINAAACGVDLLAFTGHKSLLGPTGTGGLYLKEGVELRTMKEGGTGGMSQSPFQPEDPPDRYEAGTMNIMGLAGLNASVNFLLETGVEKIRAHEIKLMELLMDGLDSLSGIVYYGPAKAQDRLGLISFNIKGHYHVMAARRLDEDFGIMVRGGLHCAPQAHELIGTGETGAVRVSVGWSSTEEEVERLIDALARLSQ